MKETESKQVLDSSHLGTLEELLSDMKYGSITLVIQDGKIVQIDKTEKYRIKN
ncbi:YezD family protein [Dorea acetigenes]|jgi:hypothetical protein|uniref:YezD family protein n=1 Tax=Dorea acetigenes TaxID=2981787 RepID=A0ABT2RMT1_9FIRM|nr:YezD family protein [Dorea acetigenes]MCB6414603.1 YezD family protein [Faecalimonas umbilicata]MCU6686707.1 YezD family protein [Dorea acetigenes]SCJ07538.1 Uncharacterized small protein (DUF2292) [uncultured Clostridium sp.]